ncbi:proteasome ATPase [Corynebacterium gerontici]|uniref:AAA ATPase forming ring-shaped complexes n=1 Tax=Corynebacterium gerontici TaxID=2079234 RepID=A0A3G6J063_9CORY|nr:proteasome ATPase [Corynebacterium gerontici]AZA11421.1 Proteasome-associated ATPase [Corynebacterium gerontici]
MARDRLGERNAKLAEVLRATRDKLQLLQQQLEELADPPSTYGTLLELGWGGVHTAEVFTAGRRMRLKVSPSVDPSTLVPGTRVRLGEASQVVESCGFANTGVLVTLIENISQGRVLVADHNGEEHVVEVAAPLLAQGAPTPKAGDTLLVDLKAGFCFEVIPKTEVTKLVLEEIPDVTYQEIGGLDSQIEDIQDAVELPFTHPELYREYDLRPPKGVLLYGPPGCGKTLIAKAVAHSLSERIGGDGASYFINVKGPELLNKFVGETERRIRLIFERARELAQDGRPVIVFFDEMESIFRTRGSGVSSDMETTVVPQLLAELDGVEGLSNVIVVGATNREELIDPAILRPGRLDVKIRVERPGKAAARDIFTKHLQGDIPLSHGGELQELINAAVDYLFADKPFIRLSFEDGSVTVLHYRDFASGAMIANIVDRAKKAAIKAHIRRGEGGLSREHFYQAIDAENRENEDLPNTSHPELWTRLLSKQTVRGRKIQAVEILAGS